MRMTRVDRVLALCSLASNHGSTNSQSSNIAINLDIIVALKLTSMKIFQNDQELWPSVEAIRMKSFIRLIHHGMCLGVLQLDKDSTMIR